MAGAGAIQAGIAIAGAVMQHRAAKKSARAQRDYQLAQADLNRRMADRLESQGFIAPYVPNTTYIQRAELTRLLGGLAAQRGKIQFKDAKRRAIAEQAVSQRQAYEERKVGEITSSDALAAGVAGGGTSEDFNFLRADIETDAEYNALSRLYEGDVRAQDLRFRGEVARWQGEVDRVTAEWNANQIIAEGQYANEMGARQNAAAYQDYRNRIFQLREGARVGVSDARRQYSARAGAANVNLAFGIASGIAKAYQPSTTYNPYSGVARSGLHPGTYYG